MGTSIKRVTAVRDAIDRLEWQVAVGTGFFGTLNNQAFAYHWDGSITFHRESPNGPQPSKVSVAARWTNRAKAARFHVPNETEFTFATELPGDALDRIEDFRDGGRLYALLQGQLFLLYKDEHVVKSQTPRPWVDDAVNMLGGNRVLCADLHSESLELTRDLWCKDVLGTLRPPGRFVFDVQVPIGHADEEVAKRALAHLAEARKTLDEGRDGEVGRICYRVLDELRKIVDSFEERYGKFARDRIAGQIKETQSICNPERHGDRPEHDDLAFDRPLAQHVLAVTSSIAGVLLR